MGLEINLKCSCFNDPVKSIVLLHLLMFHSFDPLKYSSQAIWALKTPRLVISIIHLRISPHVVGPISMCCDSHIMSAETR